MAGGLSLEPQLIARMSIKGCVARFYRFPESFFVHKAHHEHAPCFVVLNDGCDEPIEFAKIEFHSLSPKRKPTVAGGLLNLTESDLRLSVSPSRRRMAV